MSQLGSVFNALFPPKEAPTESRNPGLDEVVKSTKVVPTKRITKRSVKKIASNR